MATLDDKILGEKCHNYCSSSEDSEEESESNSEKDKVYIPKEEPELPEVDKWDGTSSNTGPKGVLRDWERYKQLESEKRLHKQKQRINLVQNCTLTVQSALDEEGIDPDTDDPEILELYNDEHLLAYQKQRMEEMLKKTYSNIKFGNLHFLRNRREYLECIDDEDSSVKIIIHIYEDNVEACRTMNKVLVELAALYTNEKFCAIVCSVAGMSKNFITKGVPALLVYKDKQLIGNFVKLADELGNDFYTEDVQGYLVEHGMLEDKTCVPSIIRNGNVEDED